MNIDPERNEIWNILKDDCPFKRVPPNEVFGLKAYNDSAVRNICF